MRKYRRIFLELFLKKGKPRQVLIREEGGRAGRHIIAQIAIKTVLGRKLEDCGRFAQPSACLHVSKYWEKAFCVVLYYGYGKRRLLISPSFSFCGLAFPPFLGGKRGRGTETECQVSRQCREGFIVPASVPPTEWGRFAAVSEKILSLFVWQHSHGG